MYRSKLTLGALTAAGLAVAQLASAQGPSAPDGTSSQAQGGLTITPSILEATARRGATGQVTISNTTRRRLRVSVRVRPWRQARSGAVAADRRRSLGRVRASPRAFTLAAGAQRTVAVRLSRVPSRRSIYGALDVLGKPTKKRKGINVAYRLVSSLRFNPPAAARRFRLGVGAAKSTGRGARRALVLRVRNRGNTIEPVGGSASVTGSGGGRSGSIPGLRILPGKAVNLRLMSLRGLAKGSYRVAVTLTQGGRNVTSATRSFRIRR